MKNKIVASLLAAISISFCNITNAGLFTGRALVDPVPIELQPPRNSLQIFAAITSAASSTGWKSEIKDQDTVQAVYMQGNHSAEVQFKVTPNKISLMYVSSRNLGYSEENGQREIHKAYIGWVRSLELALKKRLASLCTDLSLVQNDSSSNLTYKTLAETVPFMAAPVRSKTVKSSSGAPTGYIVREYQAFFPNGRIEDCSATSAIFFNDKLISIMRAPLEPAALAAYTDVLYYLVENNKLSFADAEYERVSLKLDTVTPLDSPRRDELLRFVEWQTQRLAKSEIARQEYEYVLAEKEAALQERQGSIQT